MQKKKIAFVVAIPGSAESFLVNHLEQLTKTYDVSLIANFPENYDTLNSATLYLTLFISA